MLVDVWSDVVCPWCYIGLANLDAALDGFEHAEDIEVRVHAFQLDPEAPRRDDQPLEEMLAAKYGTTVAAIRVNQERIVALGAERGIDFRFDRSVRGNTFDAHRLLHLAADHDLQLALKHRLGRAYFTDGDAIGEPDTLRRAALDVGLPADEVDRVLAGDAHADDVRTDLATARRLGINGVPFFVFDGRLAVNGAQPDAVLRDALEQAWASREPAPLTVLAGTADPDADGGACGPEGCEVPTAE